MEVLVKFSSDPRRGGGVSSVACVQRAHALPRSAAWRMNLCARVQSDRPRPNRYQKLKLPNELHRGEKIWSTDSKAKEVDRGKKQILPSLNSLSCSARGSGLFGEGRSRSGWWCSGYS